MEWHEIAIIALLFDRKELAMSLSEDLFDDPKSREIFQVSREIIRDNKTVSTKEISLILGSDYDKYMKKLRKMRRDPPDEDLVLRMLGNKIVKSTLLDMAPKLAKLELGDYEDLKKAIKDAESLPSRKKGTTMEEFANEMGDDYMDFKNVELEKYPTFLKNVYLYPGEVGIIQAAPKGGKTTGLVNIASLGVVHGHRVGFWELERPLHEMMERFALRITGTKDFYSTSKRIKLFGGELLLRVEPYCTPRDLRSWCLNDRLDMLVVDYFDYIKVKREKEKRFELSEIFQFSRNLAKEFNIPVWTASQSNAKAVHKKWQGLDDLEEAKIAKSGIASLVIGINQNDDEKEESVARMNFVVSTHGYKGYRMCEFNFEKQLVRELNHGKED